MTAPAMRDGDRLERKRRAHRNWKRRLNGWTAEEIEAGARAPKPPTPRPHDEAIASAYLAGRTVTSIAADLGISGRTVREIRRRLGVTPRRTVAQVFGATASLVAQLYAAGENDEDIARRVNVTPGCVRHWRRKSGLVGHARGERSSKSRRQRSCPPSFNPIFRNDLYLAANRAVPKWMAADIRDDVIADIMLAVVEGHLTPAQIPQAAKQYANRTANSFANRWGHESLDENIDGEDFNLHWFMEDERQMADLRTVELECLAERLGLDARSITA